MHVFGNLKTNQETRPVTAIKKGKTKISTSTLITSIKIIFIILSAVIIFMLQWEIVHLKVLG